MCGIAGIYNLDNKPVSKKRIERMGEVLSHRGPDSHGVFVKDAIGFAHRRLKIIDLSRRADQPMWDLEKRAVIIYNGIVYNFKEIRQELTKYGFRFRSRTDTEVVLNGYLKWGYACVNKFNGMFAFAIWDKNTESLFLARDRYGIKPLYYYYDGTKFIFASEIKAIIKNRELKREIDPEAMVEYWSFQNIFSDKTLFKGIKILPAGSWISVNKIGLRIKKYWDFDFSGYSMNSKSDDLYISALKELFPKVIKRALVSDVPLGSYLSGGLDSATIVSIASKFLPGLKTFTAGFDTRYALGIEADFDERPLAVKTSKKFNTDYHELLIKPKQMKGILPKLIWHLEDLRVGMCYHNYFITQFARESVKVVLSGTGGDELLAGYPWRYQRVLKVKNNAEFLTEYYNYWTRLIPDGEKNSFFTKEFFEKIKGYSAREVFKNVCSGFSSPDPKLDKLEFFLNKAFYFEAKTFLHGLFIVEDKISMANSLEVRLPFLDNELVDILQKVPPLHKVSYEKSALEGKLILRKLMEGRLPKEVLSAAKMGFSPTDASWYREEGYNYIREILLSSKSLKRGFFRKSYISRIIDEHFKEKRNYRLLIWSLLCFEWWNRIFIDKKYL